MTRYGSAVARKVGLTFPARPGASSLAAATVDGEPMRAWVKGRASSGGTPVFVRGRDHGLVQSSPARSTVSRSLYDDAKLDCFEGNGKAQWIDEGRGVCYMCHEPFGSQTGIHFADRDHNCLGLFLWLYSQYPRNTPAEAVLGDAFGRFNKIAHNARGPSMSQDHLHCYSDSVRRSELEAILWHLTDGPNACLTDCLKGQAPLALWVSGERIFKINVTRLASIYLPPIAPGIHSAFTQKCWGRSNQERGYECLNIAKIHRHYGVEPKTTRDSRAFFMRSLIWEMHTALDSRDITPVAETLLREALRRYAFELIFLQSMYYMNRVQDVIERLGAVPTLEELNDLNSL